MRRINNLIDKIIRFIYSTEKYAVKKGVKIGSGSRLIGNVEFGSEPYLIEIGNHVSITNSSFVTHDGGVWVLRDKYPDLDCFGKIKVGNNVFIGTDSLIMPGVIIGNNVVIGACSVVTKDIPDNSVVAGVPAKIIKTLEKYESDVLAKGIPTKGLCLEEKKLRILNNV